MTKYRVSIKRHDRTVCADRVAVRDERGGRGWSGTIVADEGGPLTAGDGYTLVLDDGRSYPVSVVEVVGPSAACRGEGLPPRPPSGRV